jgi:hypothetical protein
VLNLTVIAPQVETAFELAQTSVMAPKAAIEVGSKFYYFKTQASVIALQINIATDSSICYCTTGSIQVGPNFCYYTPGRK